MHNLGSLCPPLVHHSTQALCAAGRYQYWERPFYVWMESRYAAGSGVLAARTLTVQVGDGGVHTMVFRCVNT